MLSTGTFVNVLIASEQRLCRGAVTEADGDALVVEFVDPLWTTAGAKAVVHLNPSAGRFVRFAAQVERMVRQTPRPAVRFERIGENDPPDGDNRRSFRINAQGAGASATINDAEAWTLLDVSFNGFGMSGGQEHQVGEVVNVTLRFRGQQFTGLASVANVRRDDDGFRFGLELSPQESELQEGLEAIVTTIELEQLRHQGVAV